MKNSLSDLVISSALEAQARGARIAVFPELTLTGYPPEDLLFIPSFLDSVRKALEKAAAQDA